MRRRTVLKWGSRCLAGVCAALVAVPGMSFVFDALRRNHSNSKLVRRVTRLKDLPLGRPVSVPIVGARHDAWTVYPDEVLGRVWLVRQKGLDGGDDQVAAFTATCPHLGCIIQHDAKENRFVCPCHRAVFALNGQKVSGSQRGQQNHAPRGMDSLDCRLVTDDDTQEVWVEVTYQKFEQGLTRKVSKA